MHSLIEWKIKSQLNLFVCLLTQNQFFTCARLEIVVSLFCLKTTTCRREEEKWIEKSFPAPRTCMPKANTKEKSSAHSDLKWQGATRICFLSRDISLFLVLLLRTIFIFIYLNSDITF